MQFIKEDQFRKVVRIINDGGVNTSFESSWIMALTWLMENENGNLYLSDEQITLLYEIL